MVETIAIASGKGVWKDISCGELRGRARKSDKACRSFRCRFWFGCPHNARPKVSVSISDMLDGRAACRT